MTRRRLGPAFAPAFLGAVLTASLVLVPGLQEAVAPWAHVVLLGALAVAILLGLVLRRSRGAWAVTALVLTFEASRRWGLAGDTAGLADFTWAASSALLPAVLGGLILGRDRPLLSGSSLGIGALVITPPLAAAFCWLSFQESAIKAALHEPQTSPFGPAMRLTTAGWIATGLAAVTLSFVLLVRQHALEGGLLGALLPAAAGLGFGPASDRLPVLLAAGSLVVLIGIARSAFELAFLDTLTGLPGRRALDDDLQGLAGRFTVAMVDIDHFKKVNDTHGHTVGDQVLRMVAGRLALVGGGGKAYRWGGEEFTLFFPGRPLAEALPHVEAVREAVAASPFVLRGKERPRRRPRQTRNPGNHATIRVTVSAGAAEGNGGEHQAAMEAADKALYHAKREGRNRVCH